MLCICFRVRWWGLRRWLRGGRPRGGSGRLCDMSFWARVLGGRVRWDNAC